MKIRVKFSKTGNMKFVGHLDIMRYFQKAIRRSGIKASFSTGFSPHMIMSFAEPLGVSIMSYGEYFDLEIEDDPSYKPSAAEMKDLLNEQMAEGIRVEEIRKIGEDKKNKAMSLVSAADYTIFAKDKDDRLIPLHLLYGIASDDLINILDNFLAQDKIEALYRSKKGEKQINIKDRIINASVNEDGSLKLFCHAGSASNLRPSIFIESFCGYLGFDHDEFDYQIIRNEIYTNTDDNKYIPLIELGESF